MAENMGPETMVSITRVYEREIIATVSPGIGKCWLVQVSHVTSRTEGEVQEDTNWAVSSLPTAKRIAKDQAKEKGFRALQWQQENGCWDLSGICPPDEVEWS